LRPRGTWRAERNRDEKSCRNTHFDVPKLIAGRGVLAVIPSRSYP